MKINIKGKKENKLFNRQEVSFEAEHVSEATPSRTDIKTLIAAKLSVKPELVSVRNINSGYGASKSVGTVFIYKNEADLKEHEPKHIIKRAEPKAKKEEPIEPAPAEGKQIEATEGAEAPKEEDSAKSEREKNEAAPVESKGDEEK